MKILIFNEDVPLLCDFSFFEFINHNNINYTDVYSLDLDYVVMCLPEDRDGLEKFIVFLDGDLEQIAKALPQKVIYCLHYDESAVEDKVNQRIQMFKEQLTKHNLMYTNHIFDLMALLKELKEKKMESKMKDIVIDLQDSVKEPRPPFPLHCYDIDYRQKYEALQADMSFLEKQLTHSEDMLRLSEERIVSLTEHITNLLVASQLADGIKEEDTHAHPTKPT